MTAHHSSKSTEVDRLDRAIESAAGSSGAVIVDYLATTHRNAVGSAIELAIEFFVPPASSEQFATALTRELSGAGADAAPIVHSLPPGALHQWRFAFRCTPDFQRRHRWTADRTLVASVLHQADQGFREIH